MINKTEYNNGVRIALYTKLNLEKILLSPEKFASQEKPSCLFIEEKEKSLFYAHLITSFVYTLDNPPTRKFSFSPTEQVPVGGFFYSPKSRL